MSFFAMPFFVFFNLCHDYSSPLGGGQVDFGEISYGELIPDWGNIRIYDL